ncbi:MAG: hypothetical protein ACLFNK_04130 [Candidatus Woesearchaeota archaeon]
MGIFYMTEQELVQDKKNFKKGKVEPGRKIRCIDDHFSSDKELPFEPEEINLPEKNELYTVREVIDTGHGIGLRLEEIDNERYWFGNVRRYEEPVFGIHRFEPHYEIH